MTALHLADAGEAADLAAFLARLIHYDRAAAVRLQAGGGVLAVFGRPPSFEVLAIRTARLAEDLGLDITVSAGELLDGIDEPAGALTVPAAVTGPPWTGLLPPRGGWQRVPGLPAPEALVRAVAAAVAEFRARDEALRPSTAPAPNGTASAGRSGRAPSATPTSRCVPRMPPSRWAFCGRRGPERSSGATARTPRRHSLTAGRSLRPSR